MRRPHHRPSTVVLLLAFAAACDDSPAARTDVGGGDTEDVHGGDTCGPGGDTATAAATDTAAGAPRADASAPTEFFAIVVSDVDHFADPCADPCAASSIGAHGADIDAIEVADGGTSLGYLDLVDYRPGDRCALAATFSNGDAALGAPDGDADGGFVSLGGGTLAGELATTAEIRVGYTITVFEVTSDPGGADDPYDVLVASDISCTSYDCAVLVAAGASGRTSVPLSGF